MEARQLLPGVANGISWTSTLDHMPHKYFGLWSLLTTRVFGFQRQLCLLRQIRARCKLLSWLACLLWGDDLVMWPWVKCSHRLNICVIICEHQWHHAAWRSTVNCTSYEESQFFNYFEPATWLFNLKTTHCCRLRNTQWFFLIELLYTPPHFSNLCHIPSQSSLFRILLSLFAFKDFNLGLFDLNY